LVCNSFLEFTRGRTEKPWILKEGITYQGFKGLNDVPIPRLQDLKKKDIFVEENLFVDLLEMQDQNAEVLKQKQKKKIRKLVEKFVDLLYKRVYNTKRIKAFLKEKKKQKKESSV
jgi:hypothetical protein